VVRTPHVGDRNSAIVFSDSAKIPENHFSPCTNSHEILRECNAIDRFTGSDYPVRTLYRRAVKTREPNPPIFRSEAQDIAPRALAHPRDIEVGNTESVSLLKMSFGGRCCSPVRFRLNGTDAVGTERGGLLTERTSRLEVDTFNDDLPAVQQPIDVVFRVGQALSTELTEKVIERDLFQSLTPACQLNACHPFLRSSIVIDLGACPGLAPVVRVPP